MDSPTKAFQVLKPVCVALGESAKRLGEGKVKADTVANHLEKLKGTLTTETARPGALHPKLAEYVFFPISQVLRISQRASIQCLELSLQCISILVDQGWRRHLPAQTAAQLVILCTLLAEKKPQGLPFAETTEELQTSAFWCLFHSLTFAGENDETKQLLTTEAHFPQLGKTISTTLDAIRDASRVSAQVAASAALEALLVHVADREIQASFLPGIASNLTKVLTPSTKARTSSKVLTQCLGILKILLDSTLGEDAVASAKGPTDLASSLKVASSTVNEDWQLNAATQLKPVLGSVLGLRLHSNGEVRLALGRLCFCMLRTCRKSLANCSAMALEALIVLCARDRDSSLSIELEILIQGDESIASSLQDLLYEWLQSLPTVMQGVDEQAKLEKMRQVTVTYEILAESNVDISGINSTIGAVLRDSVVVTLTLPAVQKHTASSPMPLQSLDLAVLGDQRDAKEFESPLVKYRGQKETIDAIESFARAVVDHGVSVELRNGLARSLRQSSGEAQIASMWLLLAVNERAYQRQEEEDAILAYGAEGSVTMADDLEDLYSFALTVLADQTDDDADPRLKALALRALALRARAAGEEFRYELLDALYPVLHTLATPDEMLQRASITTLNILTSACGYESVKTLIVDNVDYLTNAVALKLNAFDVSPQAPQVLLMMLRLAGPTLLPYLQDTVESIFAALEDYHGYPVLVELLFRVLSVMAEEGVKAPQLAIENVQKTSHGDDLGVKWLPTTVEGLATQLRLRIKDELEAEKIAQTASEPHPQRPWGEKSSAADVDDVDGAGDLDDDRAVEPAEPGPPASRTYALLLKVTELTQHFLPSASASLRTSLLGLIRTTAPALAKHENSFLPLINTLWPEVVARLDDDERHIQAIALDIVRVLCECAGDFMRTRIVQLWPRLVEIREDVVKNIAQSELPSQQGRPPKQTTSSTLPRSDARLRQALVRMESSSSSLGDTSTRESWSALQLLVTAIVQHVHLPPELADEALDLIGPALHRPSVRAVFEEDNSDAAWLSCVKLGLIQQPPMPAVPSGRAWVFAAVAG